MGMSFLMRRGLSIPVIGCGLLLLLRSLRLMLLTIRFDFGHRLMVWLGV